MSKKILLTLTSLLGLLLISSCSHYHHGKWFDKLDTNKNNSISQKEYNKYAKEKFKAMDANKNGWISRDELREHKKNKK